MRRVGQDQLNRVEDAGDVSILLDVEAARYRLRHRVAVRPHAYEQHVFTRLEGGTRVVVGWREATGMISQQPAVQNYLRAEHGLCDFEPGYCRYWLIQPERTPIPESVTRRVLLGIGQTVGNLRSGFRSEGRRRQRH